jgi:hypothetical protein
VTQQRRRLAPHLLSHRLFAQQHTAPLGSARAPRDQCGPSDWVDRRAAAPVTGLTWALRPKQQARSSPSGSGCNNQPLLLPPLELKSQNPTLRPAPAGPAPRPAPRSVRPDRQRQNPHAHRPCGGRRHRAPRGGAPGCRSPGRGHCGGGRAGGGELPGESRGARPRDSTCWGCA